MQRRVPLGALLATLALALAAPAAAQERILYTSNACISEPGCAGGYQVYRLAPSGGVTRLTNDDCGTRQATWAPGGSTIVFAKTLRSGVSCTATNLWRMAADGSGQVAITTGDVIDEAPDVSPDGSLLAFDSSRGTTFRTRREIYVANADGSGLRRLTTHPGHDAGPRFTADGRTLIFSRSAGNEDGRFRGDPVDLWAVPVAGGPEVRLTTGGGFLGGFPATANDGSSVAFSDRGTVYALNLATGALLRVGARPPGSFDIEPSWSPDDRDLVFGRTDTTRGDAGGTDLMRAPVMGGAATRLVELNAGGFQARWPDWAPPARPRIARPARDRVAPVTLLASATSAPVRLGDTTAVATAAAARTITAKARDLRFLTVDRSGVSRVEVAITGPNRTRRPRYRLITGRSSLRRYARSFGRGTFEIRFRTTDARGNRTKRPAVARLRLV